MDVLLHLRHQFTFSGPKEETFPPNNINSLTIQARRRTIGIGEMDVRGHASFFILAVTWSSLKIGIADDFVVKTNLGKLRGFSETLHGTNILQFIFDCTAFCQINIVFTR